MGREIELKLLVHDDWKDRISNHPLVKRFAVGKASWHQLFNIYYDTPDFQLYSRGMALRVRKEEGGQLVQTLKTAGEVVGGMSHRGEWEWPLPNDTLQPDLIPHQLWPPGVVKGGADIPIPLFHTDFERSRQLLYIPAGALTSNQAEAKIELAFDRGLVRAIISDEKRTDKIFEIEMELMLGKPETLFDLALLLTAGFPVQPCDISKAERGYRLLGAQRFSKDEYPDRLPLMNAPVETGFFDEMTWSFGVWVQRLEYFQYSGNPAHLAAAGRAIERMGMLMTFFNSMLPESQTRQWQEILATVAEQCRKKVIPDGTGAVMLALAKWIYCREWLNQQ
ncbi:MAG: CYTH domain-containing protein [Desulfobacterales bacterium]|nr:CYTH domain-containing protein [Desulfobacterales bacterium]